MRCVAALVIVVLLGACNDCGGDGASDAATRDSAVAGDAATDGGVADGSLTDRAQVVDASDAARPDTARPDALQPDSARADAAQPDSAQPDAALPDAASGCFIDGQFYPDGTPHPQWLCNSCDVASSTTEWTPHPAGTPCATGMSCDTDGWCAVVQSCGESCGTRCGPGGEPLRSKIHAFYYAWYGSPEHDGQWIHWADFDIDGNWLDPAQGDLAAAFYPQLGAYSSIDPVVIEQHMQWLERAGVGVLILSWWGQTAGQHLVTQLVLDAAYDHGFKVAFYIEPYGGGYLDTLRPVGSGGNPDGTRTPFTAADDIRYIVQQYGCHDAVYRVDGRPVFYFFAAREYQNGDQADWNTVWSELHADPALNPIVIAHDSNLNARIIPGDWDGGHEYGCSFGGEQQWAALSDEYATAGKYWVASVCPGYDDARFRAAGGPETDREDGAYYDLMWSYAVDTGAARPWAAAVGTFNEWHEGTQIEPAVPHTSALFTYYDYEGDYGLGGAEASHAYLDRTKHWSDKFLFGAPACTEQLIDDAEPGGGGSCSSSAWSADGPGLYSCAAVDDNGVSALEAAYKQNSSQVVNLRLDLSEDLSAGVCAGYNALELRIKVTPLDAFEEGYLEIGNCMDCPEELQFRVAPEMLVDDSWTALRLDLGGHASFAAVDWSAIDHLRFYFTGVGAPSSEPEPAFRLLIDSLRVVW